MHSKCWFKNLNTRDQQGDPKVSARMIFETDSVNVGNELNKLWAVL